jgi:cytochrome bd ubiquinol oxidase subunit II
VELHTIWFVLIAIFWVIFLVLEGFDFGVGVLHTIVGKTDTERRVGLNTIGPWWDGNEVWLVIAGASMFAAFPGWYATMFSALYLALVIVLAALMGRGVAMEFKGKGDGQRWRGSWKWCVTLGSLLIPLLLGVGLGDLLGGLPINSSHDFTGNFFDLLTGYGLWTGVTLLGLCLLHGATFLKLRTTDEVRERARAVARPLGWAAIALVIGFVIWTRKVAGGADVPGPVEALAVIAVIFAARLSSTDHDGWAFTASAVAIAATVGSIFIDLYPHLMVSSTNAAYDLTVNNSASGHYALTVMTVVAVIFFPLVAIYQGWSFHVFSGRVKGPSPIPPPTATTPAAPQTQ